MVNISSVVLKLFSRQQKLDEIMMMMKDALCSRDYALQIHTQILLHLKENISKMLQYFKQMSKEGNKK